MEALKEWQVIGYDLHGDGKMFYIPGYVKDLSKPPCPKNIEKLNGSMFYTNPSIAQCVAFYLNSKDGYEVPPGRHSSVTILEV